MIVTKGPLILWYNNDEFVGLVMNCYTEVFVRFRVILVTGRKKRKGKRKGSKYHTSTGYFSR
jgi:hypothetical protein